MSINTFNAGGDAVSSSVRIEGLAGSGFVELPSQSPGPAAPAAGVIRTYTNSAGEMSFVDSAGFPASFALSSLTAPRLYTYPDANTALAGVTAVQTLTNKTILASGGNTIEATQIAGAPITGTPTTGQFLRYGGASWSPATLSAAAPVTITGTTIGVTVGSGGVASFSDPRFTDPRVLRVKASSVGFGEFNSVVDALASITDNSSTVRYVISVGAGIFTENAIVMKPYVYLIGDDQAATILRPAVADTTFIQLVGNSAIQNITCDGIAWTSGNSVGINVRNAANSYITSVIVRNFYTPIYVNSPTSACDVIMSDYLIEPPFNKAVYVEGVSPVSSFVINIAFTSGRIRGDASVDTFMLFEGAYCKITVDGFRFIGASNAGYGVTIIKGANVQLANGKINGVDTGMFTAEYGGGPNTINTRDILWLDNNLDVDQSDNISTGVISGQADRTKVIVASPYIVISYIDIIQPAAVNVGQFIYAPVNDAVLTDTGPLIVQTGAVGCYTGCQLTFAGGLDVGVAAGYGYIVNAASGTDFIRQISWSATTLTVPANATTYISVNESGPQATGSLPDPYANVLIGRVISGAADIEIIDMQLQSNFHPDTNNFFAQRAIGGVLFANGAITTISGTNGINVTAGVHYYANNKIANFGGTDLVYTAYYRDGLGGWTRVPSQTVVGAFYDNNSGTPVAIPVGKYARGLLYLAGQASTEQYMLVYGQAIYDTVGAAAADTATMPPPYFNEGITPIASLVSDSTAAIVVYDARPLPGSSSGSVIASVTDHGDLTGLGDDDHLQYLLVNGTRAMSGGLNMGGNAITNVSTMNSVDITAHASRHLPFGADPLTTAAPTINVSATSANLTGVSNSLARSDHSHALDVSAVSLNSLADILDVSRGGTGVSSLTSGNVLVGAGTGAVTTTKVAPTGAFVGTTDAQLLTNKDLQASTTQFVNAAGNGGVKFQAGAGAFFATLAFTFGGTGYTVTFPQGNGTVVYAASGATLQNKTIIGGVNGNTVDANLIRGATISAIAPTAGQALIASDATNAAWGDLTSIAGTLTVAKGGTSLTTLTSGRVLVGAGTSPVDLSKTAPVGDFVGTTDTQTLTNKTLAAATTTINGAGPGDNITFTPSGATSIVSGGAGTLTLPAGTRTIVALDTTDTLTNKTLTSTTNTVAAKQLHNATGIVDVSAAAAPTSGQVLTATGASAATWQTPASAPVTFNDSVFAVYDNVDNTKQILFDAAGTTATSTTIVSQQAANISVTLPAASTTLVGTDTTDTLSNKTLTAPVIATIVNTGTLTLPTATDTLVGRATTDTLTNKTLAAASTLISGTGSVNFSAGGSATTTFTTAPSVSNVLTFPTSTDTVVGRATTDTLSNKTLAMATTIIRDASTRDVTFTASGTASTALTLTSALTTSRTIAFPDITDTLVTKTSTDTFTNKTIVGNGTTQIVDADRVRSTQIGAIAPTTGQVLTATSTTDAVWATPSVTTVTGTLPVANGGTGATTLTSGNVLVGNGTGAVTTTKTAPTGVFVGTTDTQSMTNKTITDVTNTVAAKQLHTATGVVSVDAAAAPSAGQVLTATGATDAEWATPSVSTVNGTLPVANGGTGATTLTNGNVLVGAGTSAVTTTKAAPSGAFVGTTDTQTLSGKTLTTPIIAQISNTGTLTLPTATDTLVGRATTDTLSNKTLDMASVSVADSSSRSYSWTATGTPSTALTLTSALTGPRTLTFPNITDTLVTKNTTDTLTNKTVVGGASGNEVRANYARDVLLNATAPSAGQVLTASTATDAAWATPSVSTVNGTLPVANGGTGDTTLTSGNVLVGNGTGAVTTTKAAPAGAFVGTTDAQQLTNKDLYVASTRFLNADGDGGVKISSLLGSHFVTLAFAPTIPDYTVTFPVGSGLVLYANSSATLGGKSITGGTNGNTVSANLVRNVTVSTNIPSAGQVLTATAGSTADWLGLASIAGTLTVAQGGTGATTLTSGNVLVGAGTSAVTTTKAAPAGAFVGTTDTQSLTNKTLSFATSTIDVNTITGVVVSGTPATDRIILATGASTATWQAIPKVRSFMHGTAVVTKTSAEAATYVSVTDTDTQGVIVYRGSATIDITAVTIRAACTAGSSVFSARLRDVTNSLDIATFVGSINSTTQTFYSTTSISNIPTANAALQLQTEFVSGSGSVTFTGWTVQLGS